MLLFHNIIKLVFANVSIVIYFHVEKVIYQLEYILDNNIIIKINNQNFILEVILWQMKIV